MKVRKLTIQNINSIYGTWEIDFQHEAYLNTPLFAIVGKTGSGKSTILDAICFALYDQTDRMDKTRSAFASFNTTECMAELEFEINGKTYIAHSSLTCNENDGSFSNTIAKSGSWLQGEGEKIEGTERKCKKVIELLGLDFKQFRQVILLAQGKFNAFLTEEPDKRATILENITGTEIYSQIGDAISKKEKKCKDDLQEKEQAICMLSILSPEEKSRQEERQNVIQEETVNTKKDIEALNVRLEDARQMDEAETKLKKYNNQDILLKRSEEAFEAEKPKLEAGRIAAKVTEAYNAFETIRKEQERDEEARKDIDKGLPAQRKAVDDARMIAEAAKREFKEKTDHKSKRETFLAEIDTLDKEITRLAQELEVGRDNQKKAEDEKKNCEARIACLNQKINTLKKTKDDAEQYLKNHQQDAGLDVEKTRWDADVKELSKERSEIQKLKQKEKTEQKKHTQAEQKDKNAKNNLNDKNQAKIKAELAKVEAEKALAHALDGQPLEALKVAKDKQSEIVSILTALNPREVLKTFVEGKPCPVCGALHHPYRQEQFEVSPELKAAQELLKTETDRYEAAEKASKKLQTAEQELSQAFFDWQNAQRDADEASKGLEEVTHSLEELCKETRGKEDEVASQLQKLQEKLTVFGFSWNGQDDLPPVISERIEAYKRQLLLFSGFEKQQGELNAKLAGLKGELQGKEEALRRAQSQVEKTDKELALTHKKRQDEYQDKKTKDERSTLETEYTKALTQKDKATSAFATASAELKTAENSIENLTRQINDRQEEFTRRQLECDRVLRENNLTVETYRNTLLANDEFERLVSKERELIESRKHLDKDIREQAEKKEKHLKQLPKDFNVQEAQNQLKALEDKQTELARESGGIQQILDSNKKHLAQAEKLQNERNAIQIEHDRWVKLNSWLGGQKFKQLAQAYTFDALLIKANEQLQNMLNGRYQMCPHIENDKLEIDVIDNLLGGDIRTSKNLSGGEQFIISMSLALGLANMVGEKLRIESLFLDEGFGTLDGNELEEAMKTLSQLKGDGKLVGIITHAERLQERISTRISIEKQGNGRSNLDGPGVTFKAKPTIFIRKEKETPSNDRQRK